MTEEEKKEMEYIAHDWLNEVSSKSTITMK